MLEFFAPTPFIICPLGREMMLIRREYLPLNSIPPFVNQVAIRALSDCRLKRSCNNVHIPRTGIEHMRVNRHRAPPYTTSYQHNLPQLPNHVPMANHVSFEPVAIGSDAYPVPSTSSASHYGSRQHPFSPYPNSNHQRDHQKAELTFIQQQHSPLQT